jgi:hypothetical protein
MGSVRIAARQSFVGDKESVLKLSVASEFLWLIVEPTRATITASLNAVELLRLHH